MTDDRPVLGLDADDTLWENQARFDAAQAALAGVLAPWADADTVDQAMLDIERINVTRYGYGAKSFTLSSVEAAIRLSDGTVNTDGITAILDAGKQLLDSPVELLDGVADTIDALAADYRLLIVTKGDPSDQHRKVSACGIDDRFWAVEVVPEKDPATYRAVLGRHDVAPEAFTMVGNSVPSDVLPVLAVGGRAVHIPHHSTWLHEVVDPATITHDFPVLDSFGQLPGFLPGFLAGDR